MIRFSLCATIVGIGLLLTGPTQPAHALGLFHHHLTSQQSFAFTAPAMTTQAVTFAAPMAPQAVTFAVPVAPQAVTFAAPVAPQAVTFAAPVTTAQALSLPAQTATQYALVPLAASGQAQAQSVTANPQFGVSDISTIIDLLGKLS